MKLYILNELIEPDGVLPEVVNYVFKSKEEVADQIRQRKCQSKMSVKTMG